MSLREHLGDPGAGLRPVRRQIAEKLDPRGKLYPPREGTKDTAGPRPATGGPVAPCPRPGVPGAF